MSVKESNKTPVQLWTLLIWNTIEKKTIKIFLLRNELSFPGLPHLRLFAEYEDNTNGSFVYVFIVCLWIGPFTGYPLVYTHMIALGAWL